MSNKTKYTPGPWAIVCGRHYAHEIQAKSKRGKDWIIARITASKVGQDEAEANANLVAAAPELLEAIEEYFEVWANNGKKPGWCNRVDASRARLRAAIAKAKGGVA